MLRKGGIIALFLLFASMPQALTVNDVIKNMPLNNADLTFAEGALTVWNPTSRTIMLPNTNFTVYFEKASGINIKTLDIYYVIPLNWTWKNVTEYTKNCYPRQNPNQTTYDFCFKNVSGYHNENVSISPKFVPLSGRSILPYENFTVYFKATYDPGLGRRMVDWIAAIKIDSVWYNQTKYAWWDTSWSSCSNLTLFWTNAINRVNEPAQKYGGGMLNLSGLTGKNANSSDMRIVNAPCNQGGSSVPRKINANGTIWAQVIFEANMTTNATNYSVYWGNAAAGEPTLGPNDWHNISTPLTRYANSSFNPHLWNNITYADLAVNAGDMNAVTDGFYSNLKGNAIWYKNTGGWKLNVTVDLGKNHTIWNITYGMFSNTISGVGYTEQVDFFGSIDNVTWTYLGTSNDFRASNTIDAITNRSLAIADSRSFRWVRLQLWQYSTYGGDIWYYFYTEEIEVKDWSDTRSGQFIFVNQSSVIESLPSWYDVSARLSPDGNQDISAVSVALGFCNTSSRSSLKMIYNYTWFKDGASVQQGTSGNYSNSVTITRDASTFVSSGEGVAWWSPSNAQTSDDVNATSSISTTTPRTQFLNLTNWGFSIPADATINGVMVMVERKVSSTTAGRTTQDYIITLMKDGIGVGQNLGTSTAYTTSDVSKEYGNSSYLWQTPLTPADVNSLGFGVNYSALASAGSSARVVGVDHINLTVYYTTNDTSWANGTEYNVNNLSSPSVGNYVFQCQSYDLSGHVAIANSTYLNITSSGVSDSCTAPPINNDWVIAASDFCNITASSNLGSGILYIWGAGSTTFSGGASIIYSRLRLAYNNTAGQLTKIRVSGAGTRWLLRKP